MPTPNEVELLIRAKNEAGKTLQRLGRELDELVESQKALTDSTQLAKKSQAELVAQAKQLLTISDALNATLSKVDGYKKQQQALAELNAQLEKQKKTLADARLEFEKLDKPTKAQKQTFLDLSRAVGATESAISKGASSLTRLGSGLQKLGVSTEDIVVAERDLVAQQERVTNALSATSKAVDGLDAAQKRAAAGQEESLRRQARAQALVATNLARITELREIDQAARERRQADLDVAFGLSVAEKQLLVARELEKVERDIAETEQRQLAVETELAKRNAAQEASLKRQVSEQQRINALLGVRNADPERARSRETDVRAAFAEESATRQARAEELAAAATQRRLDIQRRADEVEQRSNANRERSVGILGRITAALRGTAAAQERGTTLADRRAAVEDKVQTELGQTAAALDRTTAAQRRQNREQENGFQLQRTALSLYQRIRGQLLSVAGAYVGLFGAINLVQKSIDDVNSLAGVQTRLLVVAGNDAQKAGQEYAYLQEQANRLGLDFLALANGYSKFAIAAKGANLGLAETRFIFESFAETSKVFRLSTDETAGVFRALEQILSKSKVQAEELRGQLGDRLSGAFNVLADSIGKTPAQLDKLLESGKVSSDFLLLFAREYREIVAKQLPAATQSLDSNIRRMGNALRDVRVAFLNGPFREELEKLIAKFTAFLKSDEGRDFAVKLSQVFAAAGKAILFLADNIELVGTTIAIVFGAKTIALIVGFAGTLATAAKGAAALSSALGLGGLVAAARAAGVALVALIGGPIGILVALAATGIVIAVSVVFKQKKEFADMKAALEDSAERVNEATTKVLAAKTRSELEPALAEARAVLETLDEQIAKGRENLRDKVAKPWLNDEEKDREARARFGITAKKLDDLEARRIALDASITSAVGTLEKMPDVATEGVDAAIAANDQLKTGLEAQFKALEEAAKALGDGSGKEGEKAAKKAAAEAKRLADLQLRLKEQFSEQAAAIGKDIAEAEGKSFERARDIIDANANEKIRELENLRAAIVSANGEIDKLLQTSAVKANATLTAVLSEGKFEDFSAKIDEQITKVNLARELATRTAQTEFNTKQAGEAEQRINELLTTRAQSIQTINDLQKAGAITQEDATARIATLTSTIDPQIEAALLATQTFLSTLSGPEIDAAIAKVAALAAQFAVVKTELTPGQVELANIIKNNVGPAIDGVVASLGDFLKGAASIGDVFKSIGQAARQFFSQMLIDIGTTILKAVILKAILNAIGLGSAGGDGGGGLAGAIVGLFHEGGVVGEGGKQTLVDPRIFRNARRYHDGGVVGLKPNEVPAILEKGETVVPKDGVAGGARPPQNIQVNNVIDVESVIQSAAGLPSFTKAIMNVVRAERTSFKQALA